MKSIRLLISLFIFTTALYAQDIPTIAVLNLDFTGISEHEAIILTKKLSSELVNLGQYRVLDRSEMSTILDEQGFQQMGGCNSSECAVEVGQLLGVQKMVAGSVGKIGSIYYTEIRLLDVETSEITRTVDHSQVGGIEDVLLTSMPYVAAQLSGSAVSQQNVSNEQINIQNMSADTFDIVTSQDVIIDEPVVEDDTAIQVDTDQEITLFAHHRGADILMNGEVIGTNSVTIPIPASSASFTERMRVYESKPEEFNIANVNNGQMGVGGKYQEAFISFGFAILVTPKFDYTMGKITIGGLRQSRMSHGLTLCIGSLGGFGAFSDTPDNNMMDETAVISLGGFYEFRYEWDLFRIIKMGMGVDVGMMFNQAQSLENPYLNFRDNFIGENRFLKSEYRSVTFGGPQFKMAVGNKKIFLEMITHLQMGVDIVNYEVNGFDSWEPADIFERDGESLYNYSEFAVNPMIAFSVLFVL